MIKILRKIFIEVFQVHLMDRKLPNKTKFGKFGVRNQRGAISANVMCKRELCKTPHFCTYLPDNFVDKKESKSTTFEC